VQELPVVLVIEDDPDIQLVLEGALTEGGFEPAIAASGEEAVTLLKGGLVKYRAMAIQRDRPCLSHRLHHRCGGRALAVARRAQQRSFRRAVRASRLSLRFLSFSMPYTPT
jgi:CheY-like chemotaxis protein